MLYGNGQLPSSSLNSETNKQGNMGNKLRIYRKFKNLFKFEEYLQFGSKTEQQNRIQLDHESLFFFSISEAKFRALISNLFDLFSFTK
jgi:flavodoxin